tara:strand:+ start:7276 stop:8136 length:861 start_codon:yes stop_codon:yes gene_type:complete
MPHNLLNKLAAEEEDFLTQNLLSPVIQGYPIRVRIANIVMNLNVTRPKNFQGWGVFRPTSFKEARRVREPDMQEKEEYLNLFPALRFILCTHVDNEWYGLLANADSRFKITGIPPIHLSEEVQMFDTVVARFDGLHFWFHEIDINANPATAIVLREHLINLTEASDLKIPGLTREERIAYGVALLRDLEERKDHKEERIKDILRRAGAEYRSYVERGNTVTVEIVVDGETYHPVLYIDTLGVERGGAGICLSGGDRKQDLQSLIGVYREGQERHAILRGTFNQYEG